MTARFGPAGSSESFLAEHSSSLKAPGWLAERGLNALEVQFGHGVNMGEKTARQLGESAREHNVALSVHAPYYISLASPEPAMREKNLRYIRQSAEAAAWMGASRVVVHTGSAQGGRDQALARALDTLRAALDMLEQADLAQIRLLPETMGKVNQLGDLDEVLQLCAQEPRLRPCVDFGHLYARGHGDLDDREKYAAVLDAVENAVGQEGARSLHLHFSQIEFSKGGEVRHLRFDNGRYGPDFAPLAVLFARRGYAPTVICESKGTQAEDAVAMRALYLRATQGYEP